MGTNHDGDTGNIVLTPLEKDAIGEVMNISMGSAATAVSQMLDRQVEITTPVVDIQQMGDVRYDHYEPALLVKIVYTNGLTGSNVMVFRQHDMQMILNTLMGIPDPPSDDFVFDELSISAACEVMNQMMGSSATALAEFLGKTVDISTPTATVMEDENTFKDAMDLPADATVATITFKLTIKDMLESEFISVMTT
ncbi:chemotaxis protein CheC, partial [Ruminococcaceae bacterium OttesenSCG-928-O06]|nr:chemotaxis protein CheC [Ruminococcaceae bacterium OttesenSCG-928-O06]